MTSADLDMLREINRAAAAFYTAASRRQAAIDYLRQRGIDATVLPKTWALGYAPPGWTPLVDTFREQFSDQALLDAGVARLSSRGTLIDTFRDRVLFRIRDTDGTVAGFIGRDLSGHALAPKYINTHQNPLFNKSRLLYGLYEGTRGGDEPQPVVVEGPLDVLAITARQHHGASSDLLLPVAACGTSFTPEHARAVAYTVYHEGTPVMVAMDADLAGRAAALSAGERLRKDGLDVRVAMLPSGTDPADYLANADNSLDAFRADHGVPLIRAHVENAIARRGDRMQWIEDRVAVTRSLARYLAAYPPEHTAHQIGWLAGTLDLAPSTVTSELADAYRRPMEADPNHVRRVAHQTAPIGL